MTGWIGDMWWVQQGEDMEEDVFTPDESLKYHGIDPELVLG